MNNSQNPDLEPLSRTQILMAMAVTAVVLLTIAKLWLYFGDLKLRPLDFSPLNIGLGVAIGLGITGLSGILYRLWRTYRESADLYLVLVLKPLTLADLIWLGLLPALSEELLFRGVMLPAIGLDPIGIILSSICFGILHTLDIQQWSYAVWATLVGIVFAIIMVETGNLLIPIVAHLTTNLISGLSWKLEKGKTER
jgi:membrane protease YdiL (CAAX protease family)